ncbi:TPA: energy transducer TonB [Morganella morganii]|nr:energy transducer TonB [Morganella morganii]
MNRCNPAGLFFSLCLHGGLLIFLFSVSQPDYAENGNIRTDNRNAMLLLPAPEKADEHSPDIPEQSTESPLPVISPAADKKSEWQAEKNRKKRGNKPLQKIKKPVTAPRHDNDAHKPAEVPDTGLQSSLSAGNHNLTAADTVAGQQSDDELWLYREKMRREILRYIYYPARIRKISAAVDINVSISATGALSDPVVIRSSGNRILDKIALGAVSQYQPVGIPPPGLDKSIVLTVDFIK